MIDEKQDFSRFGKQFQENLCNLILDDSQFAAQIGEVLDINFLVAPYFDSDFLDNISIIMNKKFI